MSRDLQAIVLLAASFPQGFQQTAQVLVAVGWNETQAAATLGISAVCLRKRLSRARERITEVLGAGALQQNRSVDANLRFGADDRLYRFAKAQEVQGTPDEEEAP